MHFVDLWRRFVLPGNYVPQFLGSWLCPRLYTTWRSSCLHLFLFRGLTPGWGCGASYFQTKEENFKILIALSQCLHGWVQSEKSNFDQGHASTFTRCVMRSWPELSNNSSLLECHANALGDDWLVTVCVWPSLDHRCCGWRFKVWFGFSESWSQTECLTNLLASNRTSIHPHVRARAHWNTREQVEGLEAGLSFGQNWFTLEKSRFGRKTKHF